MKEIKILIRVDEENNKLGFLLQRDEKESATISEVLKVIGVLDVLKNRELTKLTQMQSKMMRKDGNGWK